MRPAWEAPLSGVGIQPDDAKSANLFELKDHLKRILVKAEQACHRSMYERVLLLDRTLNLFDEA